MSVGSWLMLETLGAGGMLGLSVGFGQFFSAETRRAHRTLWRSSVRVLGWAAGVGRASPQRWGARQSCAGGGRKNLS